MKLCLFVAMCACLVFYSTATVTDPQLEKLGNGEYQIYSAQLVESSLVTNCQDTGFSYIYSCDSKNAGNLRKLFTKIDGESITIKNKSAKSVLDTLNYRQVSQSVLGSIKTIYAYSARAKTFIKDGKQKINLQIYRASSSSRTTQTGKT